VFLVIVFLHLPVLFFSAQISLATTSLPPSSKENPEEDRSEYSQSGGAAEDVSYIKSSAGNQDRQDEATRLYLFAEELYQTGQYYRALTEYQRFHSYYPSHEMRENVMFKIGLCYFLGKKYEEGVLAFEEMNRQYPETALGKEALLLAGECYRKNGLTIMAMEKFRQLAENSIQDETTVKAVYTIGLIYSKNGKLGEAAENFKRLEENPDYIELSKKLLEDVDRYKNAKKKSPVAAGILAIVPGLGHIYCERPKDALVSFLLNGAFTWGAVESFRQGQNVLGGILAFFELGWYLGNIHSAVGSAHKYNRHQEKMFSDNLEESIELRNTDPAPPYSSSLIISFDIPF
jgi:outer membrane protein assembly factor BamD (BamD/ComL family)